MQKSIAYVQNKIIITSVLVQIQQRLKRTDGTDRFWWVVELV